MDDSLKGVDIILEVVDGICATLDKVPANFQRRGRNRSDVFSAECVGLGLEMFCLVFRFTVIMQASLFSARYPRHKIVLEKAKCIRHDFKRIFAELAVADARRVGWSILNGSHDCDRTIARLLHLAYSMRKILALEGMVENTQGIDIGRGRKLVEYMERRPNWVDYIGIAVWQVTCNFTHSPTPSAPPPPYTLYASNIELPPIEWPDTNEPEVRLWSTKSEGSCKRSPVKGTQSAIIQNLLRLADNSSAVSEPEQEPCFVELSEDSEEEGGARLPGSAGLGCIAPTLRQKRKPSPSPRKHISRAASETLPRLFQTLQTKERLMRIGLSANADLSVH